MGVADDGVKELATLTNLTTLSLGGTKASKDGVKKLQEALPKCKLNR